MDTGRQVLGIRWAETERRDSERSVGARVYTACASHTRLRRGGLAEYRQSLRHIHS